VAGSGRGALPSSDAAAGATLLRPASSASVGAAAALTLGLVPVGAAPPQPISMAKAQYQKPWMRRCRSAGWMVMECGSVFTIDSHVIEGVLEAPGLHGVHHREAHAHLVFQREAHESCLANLDLGDGPFLVGVVGLE